MFSWITSLKTKEKSLYVQAFQAALKRTEKWGLARSDFQATANRYANEQSLQVFQRFVEEHLSHRQAEDVSQQCFAVTAALKGPLEEALGVPLAFTLGYVEFEGRNVFHTEPEQLHSLLKGGMSSPALNLHAWLTLPSHEVIDMTFGTTYGVVTQTPAVVGRMCFIHPDDMTRDMQYRPQLVGEEYLERIGGFRTLLVLH